MQIQGREYSNIGTIRNGKKIYDFGYDGTNVNFAKRLLNGNHADNTNNLTILGNRDSNNRVDIPSLVEKVVFTKVCETLNNEYGKIPDMDERFSNMSLYIGMLNEHLSDIKAKASMVYDFSTPEKTAETEAKFAAMCNDIFVLIDSKIKTDIRIAKQTQSNIVDNNSSVVPSEEVNLNTNGQVFSQVRVSESEEAVNTATTDIFDVDVLREKLTVEEKEEANRYLVEGAQNELYAILMVLNNRESVQQKIAEGYTLQEAIAMTIDEPVKTESNGISLEKPKVLVKERKEAAYIDTIVLSLVAQLTIFALIIGVLMIIK